MADRRDGLATIETGRRYNDLGTSDIIVFRYDALQGKFTSITGDGRAFLGYPRLDWLSAAFLENTLTGQDRFDIPHALGTCARGQQVICECVLITATGAEVSAVIAGLASVDDPTQVSGQILLLDPDVTLTHKRDDQQAVHVDLMRVLVSWLSHQTRLLSGYGEQLTRHVGTQEDDLGSELALGIRTSIGVLDQAITKLRSLTMPTSNHDDVTEVIEFLTHELRIKSLSRHDG